MQVAAVGSRSDACGSSELPAICMDRPGSRYLKPKRGARLHAVTNFSSSDCCSAVKLATTCSKHMRLDTRLEDTGNNKGLPTYSKD